MRLVYLHINLTDLLFSFKGSGRLNETDQKRERLILLHRVLSRKKINYLMTIDATLETAFLQTPSELSKTFQLTPKIATRVYQYLHNTSFHQQIKEDKQHYHIVTIYDKIYPPLLRQINDPPLVLYALGDTSLLQLFPSISVIGTRKPSFQAKDKLATIVTPLIECDWVIVSGMAYGIDGLAHALALKESGKTIAVLGSGFEYIYPQKHLLLFQDIVQFGLVISEYPPQMKPRKYHFPERNRIISGLSLGTLVVEANEKSGTFITVDQALDQGRDVYAIPDSPLNKYGLGCLTLISEGAKLVVSAKDIMEDWPIK